MILPPILLPARNVVLTIAGGCGYSSFPGPTLAEGRLGGATKRDPVRGRDLDSIDVNKPVRRSAAR